MECENAELKKTVKGIVALNERDASLTAGWKGLVKTKTVGIMDGGGLAAGNSF